MLSLLDEFNKKWFNRGYCTGVPNAGKESAACCKLHDQAYGKRGLGISRKEADQRLRDCVAANGHPKLAKWGYYVVRAVGWLVWKKKVAVEVVA